METLKLIEISCCVGFGLVFGGGAALAIVDIISKLGAATGNFLARIFK